VGAAGKAVNLDALLKNAESTLQAPLAHAHRERTLNSQVFCIETIFLFDHQKVSAGKDAPKKS